jgi:hypothetical protein
MPQVNIKLDKETKDDWEEYIENEGDINTKSGLIRLAVSKYISDTGGGNGVNEEMVNQIKEGQQDIKEDIEDLREKTRIIKTEVLRDKERIRRVSYEVLQLLPRRKPKDQGTMENMVSFDNIVSRVDYAEETVRKAANLLLEEVDEVDRVDEQGEEYYYRGRV